ncbi:MAG TPA: HEAT repeat domain-containing protein [Candidatus Binatus sp.]|nr:HEAT repeat domain-containing protein [Candidatus Binatus sp.]
MRTPRAEIPRLLELSRDGDSKARLEAVRALCPCEVKVHDSQIWDRFLEMADDPDAHVRRWIIHVLCDGSPSIYEARIVGVLEKFQNDPDERVKRRARKVLASHRHSGTLNVL